MIAGLFIRWWVEKTATALMETVILFPVLLTMLMGCFDLGQGISVNQKTVSASQMMADLIARQRSVTMDVVNDIIMAGQLAIEPYDRRPFGYDIVSVRYDEGGDPEVLWRVTENMEPNNAAIRRSEGLGEEGEGVIIVTAHYIYTPTFVNFVVDEIEMTEEAFLRGRRSATVTCEDC